MTYVSKVAIAEEYIGQMSDDDKLDFLADPEGWANGIENHLDASDPDDVRGVTVEALSNTILELLGEECKKIVVKFQGTDRTSLECEAWETYVGSQTGEEFMAMSPDQTPEEAIDDYIAASQDFPKAVLDLDAFIVIAGDGIGHYRLRELLLGYLRGELEGDE